MTSEGLRIQLLAALLGLLGQQLATMPNAVMVDGYTDAVPYSNAQATYTNWELSSDRANTARRILVAGGLRETQMAQVRGHADRDLRTPAEPSAPSNRRVTITMLFDIPAGDSLASASPLHEGTLGAGAYDHPRVSRRDPPAASERPRHRGGLGAAMDCAVSA